MKILITDMHNYNGGGHVTYVSNLLSGLAQSFDFTVAAPATSRLHAQLGRFDGVSVVGQTYTSRIIPMAREVSQLRKLIRHKRFDVIHVNGAGDHRHVMLACAGLSNRPAIIWTKHNTKRASSFGNSMRARFATHACIAVCEAVERILEQSPYRTVRTSTVRLGLDVGRFPACTKAERQAARHHFFGSAADGLVVFGSVGGTDIAKGWLDLVEAIAQLEPLQRRRVRLIVAGDPPPEPARLRVQQLGLQDQVLFPGLLRDIRPVLAASDVGFVLSHAEAASYACLEMMAVGLPMLVSDAGGLPENVRPGQDGWVVPVGNVHAISLVVKAILAARFDLCSLGGSARRRIIDAFCVRRLQHETVDIYRQAVRDTGRTVAARLPV